MKKRDILGGLLLIAVAAYLILNKLELVPDVQWFRLILTLIMGYIVIKSIPKMEFFGIIMPLCFLGCVYDTELGIEMITPWTLLGAGLLVSGGLEMIFRKKPSMNIYMNTSDHAEESVSGRTVYLKNSFNSTSKYVNSEEFSEARIENNFGSCNVYFNNAVIANKKASIHLDNSFGEMNIYIPKTWRADITRDVSFGDLRIYGQGNADVDAPAVHIHGQSNFGTISIYFE